MMRDQKSSDLKEESTSGVKLLIDNLNFFAAFLKNSETFHSFISENKKDKVINDLIVEMQKKIQKNNEIMASFSEAFFKLVDDILDKQPIKEFFKKYPEIAHLLSVNRNHPIFEAWEAHEDGVLRFDDISESLLYEESVSYSDIDSVDPAKKHEKDLQEAIYLLMDYLNLFIHMKQSSKELKSFLVAHKSDPQINTFYIKFIHTLKSKKGIDKLFF